MRIDEQRTVESEKRDARIALKSDRAVGGPALKHRRDGE